MPNTGRRRDKLFGSKSLHVHERIEGIHLMLVQQKSVGVGIVSDGEVESKEAPGLSRGSLGHALNRTSKAWDFDNLLLRKNLGHGDLNFAVVRGDGWWEEKGVADGSQAGSNSRELSDTHVVSRQ